MTDHHAVFATLCVIVISFLSPQSLAQVRRSFPPPHRVVPADTWDALVAALRRASADVAIIDPCAGGDAHAHARLAALASMPPIGVPIIGYLSVTAAGMRAVQALIQTGASDIVIRGVDDTAETLVGAAHRAVAGRAAREVVSAVGAPFECLPSPVAAAIQMAFQRPQQLRSVNELAAAAHVTRRSLDRWLARAGLSSARTLLSCARVNAAFHLLAEAHVPASEAAAALGYASPRSLTREMHAVTGYSASAIPRQLSRDKFTIALGRRLVRRPAAGVAACGSY